MCRYLFWFSRVSQQIHLVDSRFSIAAAMSPKIIYSAEKKVIKKLHLICKKKKTKTANYHKSRDRLLYLILVFFCYFQTSTSRHANTHTLIEFPMQFHCSNEKHFFPIGIFGSPFIFNSHLSELRLIKYNTVSTEIVYGRYIFWRQKKIIRR